MILLTGANGQLGREFQKLFKRKGVRYIGLGREELDITDMDAVKNFLKEKNIDYIINCAAYNDVDKAEGEQKKCFALNCYAPENMALESKKIGTVFVTYSTDFVFDGLKNEPYTESDLPNPLNAYACSKSEGESRVLAAYDRSFVIRTSWVFGMGNDNFVKRVIKWSKNSEKLNIVDDQVSAPTYSKDLAEYSWKLINTERFGLYHLSNSGAASKYDVAKYVLEKIEWKGRLVRAKTAEFGLPAKRSPYSKLSSEKAEKVIGEKMPHWKNGIDRFFEEMEEGNF
ncbi:dTDP-4-dehydrorhamnose reductase [uncultured Ilyobacter sp.]|uniref:dTDP-4-dehydrorhamnose reductase n=1 Tax=uncultured Ilyobacter sp. TaxID=544433 RepID=UPI0029C801CB|nr:dTDP-4-dehydrorhamnose reductase [uncultured Ilyobacter sp.]